MPDDIKKEEEKKKEKKEVSLSEDVGKYLDEWTSNPKSTVFVKLADEYRKAGLFDEAKEICKKGLKENPHYLSGNLILAKIFFDEGEYDRSLQEVQKVTFLQNDNIMAQNLLLDLYLKKGDKNNAIKACDMISFLDPNNEEIKKKKLELEKGGEVIEEQEEKENENAKEAHEFSDEDYQVEETEEGDTQEFVLEDIEEEKKEEEKKEKGSDEPVHDEFATNTVAELYINQGFYEKGLNIYKEMHEESPNDKYIIEKIKEIEQLISEKELKEKSDKAGKAAVFLNPQDEVKEETKYINKEEQIIRLTDFLDKIKRRSHE